MQKADKVVLLVLVILLSTMVTSINTANGNPRAKELLGYAPVDYVGDTRSLNSLKKFGDKMDQIATFSYRIDAKGNLTGKDSPELIKEARKKGVKTLVMVHNFYQNFDGNIAHAMLGSYQARQNAVKQATAIVKKGGYAGINVDLEGIKPADRQKYVQFLKELKKALGSQGYMVTVAVPAKTSDNLKDLWSGGFDYKAIGQTVDRVMLMTYDEHWFNGSPGPVASLPWVERVVKYALSQIPKDKLMLGIATYGYDWSAKGSQALSYSQAMARARQNGAKVLWHDYFQVPYYIYYQKGVKHQVWFENQYTLVGKLKLVQKNDLAGIAIWRLGFEDASFWQKVSKYL